MKRKELNFMKKIVTLLLTFIMCVPLYACQSKSEKIYRDAEESQRKVEENQKLQEKIERDSAEIDRLIEKYQTEKSKEDNR